MKKMIEKCILDIKHQFLVLGVSETSLKTITNTSIFYDCLNFGPLRCNTINNVEEVM